MTSKSAFEISSDQKVHLVSAANKIGKFCWPASNNRSFASEIVSSDYEVTALVFSLNNGDAVFSPSSSPKFVRGKQVEL